MQSFLRTPQGMILVTGPTGSGKTSTLYTSLNSIKSSSNNIITLEDPIELQLPGVNQMQINTKAGVTFAERPAVDPAAGSQRHSGRRDPRPGNGGDRAAGGADGPPAAQHAAHQRRAGDDHAAVRPRHPAVPRRVVAPRHRRAAAGAAAVSVVRRPAARRAPRSIEKAGGASRLPADGSGSPARDARNAATRASKDGSRFTRCSRSTTRCAS